MRTIILLLILHLAIFPAWAAASGKSPPKPEDIYDMGIQELMGIEVVTTASGTEESLTDAPATMVVVTAKEIQQRGYTDLPEILMDLPGFDVMLNNGTTYINAYQRGYRTPSTTRTLFMINGIEDNQLWSNQAVISRQYPLSNIKRIEVLYGPAISSSTTSGSGIGRNSNTALKPEKARNVEFVALHNLKKLSHEVSLYYGHYRDVIREEGQNLGSQDVYGLEYRAKSSFPNFIPASSDITTYFNYTLTKVTSSYRYNHSLAAWEKGATELGDIARHKFNIGANIPATSHWNLNLRGNFVGKREFYTRNPLRNQGEKLGSYFVLNGVLTYLYDWFDISFKVLNLLNEDYYHPGAEAANSGKTLPKGPRAT